MTIYTERHRERRQGKWVSKHTWVTEMHEDETQSYTFDLSRDLDSGETISSVSYDDQGVTTSSQSNTSTTLTFTVTDTDGYTQASVTTSAGRVLVFIFRFAGVDEAQPERDYRGHGWRP